MNGLQPQQVVLLVRWLHSLSLIRPLATNTISPMSQPFTPSPGSIIVPIVAYPGKAGYGLLGIYAKRHRAHVVIVCESYKFST